MNEHQGNHLLGTVDPEAGFLNTFLLTTTQNTFGGIKVNKF